LEYQFSRAGLTAQSLGVPFSKTALKIDIVLFYTSRSFDGNRKGMLIGYARVPTFYPLLPINNFLKAKSTK
jgi:hypothetical protein